MSKFAIKKMERGKADQVEKLIRKQYTLEISTVYRGYFVLCNKWMPWFFFHKFPEIHLGLSLQTDMFLKWYIYIHVRVKHSKNVSPQRHGFDPRPVHVGFSMEKVPVGQIFIRVFWLSLYLVIILQSTLHIHLFIRHRRYTFSATDSVVRWHTSMTTMRCNRMNYVSVKIFSPKSEKLYYISNYESFICFDRMQITEDVWDVATGLQPNCSK